jgi:predicted AlkP superfamily pyrophosphatase or phosphodiesterase
VARGGRLGVALVCLLAACGAWSCGAGPTSPSASVAPTPPPPPPPRVLIVSVDGLRPDAIFAISSPTLRELVLRGSYSMTAQTINPSNTLPSHVSMLTGVTPAVHRITWDEYLPANGRLTVPTLFASAKVAGKRSAMVAGKEKFLTFKEAGSIDAGVISARGDADVANQAILQIDAGFDLVFVHLADVDLTGHEKQWMSAPYLERVNQADAAIGRMLRAVPPNMTVIVTADHGGSGLGHGTNSAIHMTIPWIIAGPGVRAGNQLAVRVNTYDTAVTAGYVLGFRMADVNGRVVTEAFQ